ncbi:MAG: cupin domain-containing protein [Saprospiraceae bacterium]|nr:cupin domain-containing protein [Saprospiraceae bacterium]
MQTRIENQATGTQIIVVRPAAETGGAFTETIIVLPAGAQGPPLHLHPLQEEHFETLEGILGIRVGNRTVVVPPGRSFTVPPGVPHSWFGVGGRAVRCRAIWKPSLHIEYLMEELTQSANRRKSKSPSLLEAAYVLHRIRGEYFLAGAFPKELQILLFAILALLGKSFGLVKAKRN